MDIVFLIVLIYLFVGIVFWVGSIDRIVDDAENYFEYTFFSFLVIVLWLVLFVLRIIGICKGDFKIIKK